MKARVILLSILFYTILMSCGGKEEKKEKGFTYENQNTEIKKESKKTESLAASKQVNLTNKGIGPIKSIVLEKKIDKKMVEHGNATFKKLCTACHRVDKKFIGPSVKGITERRTPEWIMNMILNPMEMTQKDPLAKDLLAEFNGSPMPNQSLSQEDARAILEYFRTLQ